MHLGPILSYRRASRRTWLGVGGRGFPACWGQPGKAVPPGAAGPASPSDQTGRTRPPFSEPVALCARRVPVRASTCENRLTAAPRTQNLRAATFERGTTQPALVFRNPARWQDGGSIMEPREVRRPGQNLVREGFLGRARAVRMTVHDPELLCSAAGRHAAQPGRAGTASQSGVGPRGRPSRIARLEPARRHRELIDEVAMQPDRCAGLGSGV